MSCMQLSSKQYEGSFLGMKCFSSLVLPALVLNLDVLKHFGISELVLL